MSALSRVSELSYQKANLGLLRRRNNCWKHLKCLSSIVPADLVLEVISTSEMIYYLWPRLTTSSLRIYANQTLVLSAYTATCYTLNSSQQNPLLDLEGDSY